MINYYYHVDTSPFRKTIVSINHSITLKIYTMFNHQYELEHIFSFDATLQSPPEVIGPVSEGIRTNFYCLGGEVKGPKLQGKTRAVGGDWLTLRTDGIGILDVRTTLETHDGALIAIGYAGVVDLGNN